MIILWLFLVVIALVCWLKESKPFPGMICFSKFNAISLSGYYVVSACSHTDTGLSLWMCTHKTQTSVCRMMGNVETAAEGVCHYVCVCVNAGKAAAVGHCRAGALQESHPQLHSRLYCSCGRL